MSKATTRDLSFTQNRELSWLKFNERVLAEAADTTVPLIERLRFVSIFTSNLDEFFMVRAGSLLDLSMIAPDDMENKSGLTPAEQLDAIYAAVRPLVDRRDKIYKSLSAALAASPRSPMRRSRTSSAPSCGSIIRKTSARCSRPR